MAVLSWLELRSFRSRGGRVLGLFHCRVSVGLVSAPAALDTSCKLRNREPQGQQISVTLLPVVARNREELKQGSPAPHTVVLLSTKTTREMFLLEDEAIA